MFLNNLNRCSHKHNSPSSSSIFYYLHRNFSLWSMKKDPDLESALSRNRRWIVNNQIKNIILRYPNQDAPVKFLQKKFKTLDLQGKALNWLKKYPCCFDVYLQKDEYHCKLSKRMLLLVEEEESVKEMQEPVFAERLSRLLMLSVNHRLNVVKLNELKRNLGFPDDYLIRILPKYPDTFRLVNHCGRRSSMEIELLSWNPDLAISSVERFIGRFKGDGEKNSGFSARVAVIDIMEEDVNCETGYQIYTVLLREGYNGSELIDKDPLVVVKDKFGELMQEGLHEYNRRHYEMNLEKQKKKGIVSVRKEKRSTEITEQDDSGDKLGALFDPEERKRFYKVLFDDDAP
ncbi:hypothetical protein OIU77_019768 [Salix suchowensis]|uniref:PORR domain-containing protein n=1 Tax=Salix suchowensis TaxID=1278906 RepID=A0ABQ9CL31_9ROSI|nr:hypothetical protein OIU77_019768 [Salix suchowensis]